jgi:hypothetical protein
LGWSVVAIVCGSLNLGTARAGIIIVAPTISLPYSSVSRTETLEVYVQDSSDPSPPEIGADNVELALPDESSVFFTEAGATTEHPYLYGGSQMPGWRVTNAGDIVLGTDFADATLPTLANGDGLLLVDFTIMGGATGSFPLTFDLYSLPNPVGTGLFDPDNNLISSSVEEGAIDIAAPPAPVPEPSSAMLALLAVLGAGYAGYLKRRGRPSENLARN